MAIILFDQPQVRTQLYPLTFTRPVSDLRIGILKISDKWELYLKSKVSWLTENYLSEKYPVVEDTEKLFINSGLCPTPEIVKKIVEIPAEGALYFEDELLAFRSKSIPAISEIQTYTDNLKKIYTNQEVLVVRRPWDIFRHNGQQIRADVDLLNIKNHKIDDPHTIIYNPENIFVEEGVKVRAAILNAENGPIYLGKNSEIKEGAMIKGPFALGESSVVNMGAKLIGDNTIGPFCKVGGEISNTVIQGYSNKSHDGFLGNSVIGEWCNIGADTNTSNLKNNYAKVKLWDYGTERFLDTGLQFCGLIMGDHAKCGINTMFNTATVVGVGANVFGEGFPRNFIPSFAWGGAKGYSTFRLDKFLEMTEIVMARREKILDKTEKEILEYVYNDSAKHRIWENK